MLYGNGEAYNDTFVSTNGRDREPKEPNKKLIEDELEKLKLTLELIKEQEQLLIQRMSSKNVVNQAIDVNKDQTSDND